MLNTIRLFWTVWKYLRSSGTIHGSDPWIKYQRMSLDGSQRDIQSNWIGSPNTFTTCSCMCTVGNKTILLKFMRKVLIFFYYLLPYYLRSTSVPWQPPIPNLAKNTELWWYFAKLRIRSSLIKWNVFNNPIFWLWYFDLHTHRDNKNLAKVNTQGITQQIEYIICTCME
jgi:hypothetical protein